MAEGPNDEKALASLAPTDSGAYVTGVFLEGASWAQNSHSLAESAAGELFCQMPVILLAPRLLSKLNDSASASRDYECPLYRTAARTGSLTTTGHSTNFITNVQLPAGGVAPSHWCKRGAALLCELAE